MIYKHYKMFLVLIFASTYLSGCSSVVSFLDEDENGKTVEQRVLAESLSTIGVTQRPREKIDYSPRKGLTIPQTAMNLPSPQGPDLSVKKINNNKSFDSTVPSHMQGQGQGDLPPDEIRVGTQKGAGLVRSVETSRNLNQQNPSELSADEWKIGEDKEKQDLFAKGLAGPMQNEVAPSALDWNLGGNSTRAPEFNIDDLKNADISRKTIYDPPSKYRVPAAIDNLKPEEIQQIERAGRSGWLPW